MITKIKLTRDELPRILEILDKFPNVDVFDIEEEGGNGIGTVTTMRFKDTVSGEQVELSIILSGVESW